MQTKSQSAVEFTLLIAALLLIFLPLFFVLTDFSFKSNTEIQSQQVQTVSQKIVDESREIFFLGRYSKEIITVNLPDYITSMSTLIINRTSINLPNEYYLIINYTKAGQKVDLPIYSEVPLINSNCVHTPGCFGGLDCYYCQFSDVESRPGIKNYLLETITFKGGNAVNISQIIW